MSDDREPIITINGRTLSPAQATVFRIALHALRLELEDRHFRRGLSAEVATAYDLGLAELVTLMTLEPPR